MRCNLLRDVLVDVIRVSSSFKLSLPFNGCRDFGVDVVQVTEWNEGLEVTVGGTFDKEDVGGVGVLR